MHLNEKLVSFRNRNELVFLITFTSSYTNPSIIDPNAVTLKTNVNETNLFDANGKLIDPSHFDPHLGQVCCVSREYLSGFVAYPMSVHRNKKCTETLDREYTNLMTLQIGDLAISEGENKSITLILRFRSLLDVENQYNDPNLDPANFTNTKLQPQSCPPHPSVPEAQYWQEMAKYIWWSLASP